MELVSLCLKNAWIQTACIATKTTMPMQLMALMARMEQMKLAWAAYMDITWTKVEFVFLATSNIVKDASILAPSIRVK